MREKVIFKNYSAKCPNCGGDLDSEHRYCPYCGKDLKNINKKYRNTEKVVVEAMDDLDSARKALKQRESRHKRPKIKVLSTVLVLLEIYFIYVLISGFVFMVDMKLFDHQVARLKEDWKEQTVEMIKIEQIDINNIEFIDTSTYCTNTGKCVQESEHLLKLPLSQKCYVYVKKDGLKTIPSYDQKIPGRYYGTSVSLNYEDCSTSIRMLEDHYYSLGDYRFYNDPVDFVEIANRKELKNSQKLNDIKVGDFVFEQYRVDNRYYAIANLNQGCFVVYEFVVSNDVDVSDAFEIVCIDVLR